MLFRSTDVVCAKTFAADAVGTVKKAGEVADDDLILDIGPDTAARLDSQLKAAGTVVWNGPMGVFEWACYAGGTNAVAQALAASGAQVIIGGGPKPKVKANAPMGGAPVRVRM